MNEEAPYETTPIENIECKNAWEYDEAPAGMLEQGGGETPHEEEKAAQSEDAATRTHAVRGMQCLSRGVALFLGMFTLLALIGSALGNESDQAFWMIDFSILHDVGNPELVGTVVRGICTVAVPVMGITLVLWAVKPACSDIRKVLTVLSLIVLALTCMQNAGDYWVLNSMRILRTPVLVPPSLVYMVIFTLLAWRVALSSKTKRKATPAAFACIALCACIAALVFPLVEIGLFGAVDHSRQADAVVVFDDQEQSGSKLSKAASARMKKAVGLYEKKLVGKMIVSSRSGSKDAPDAMVDYAKEHGVPRTCIFVEEEKTSLEGAVANSLKAAKAQGCKKLLVVSDFYHLSSIHMLYRARGKTVSTVPTLNSVRDAEIAFAMFSEVPSWWACWFKSTLLS